MINSLSLPGYQLVDSDEQNEDIHFRLEAPTPVACEGCGVQGEFVRFGKRDVPYRDLPIHGKRVLSGWSAADTPAGPARQHSGPSYRRWWTDSV
ncbi:transposase InsB1 (plasmid) [Alteromonas mediterranea 615]|uniref:Transposase InsB1 n=1 Tax=Alteromonas mediterranea 615 TaxID=1300253 RepID=S5AJ13_9ALTE|nr:transposase InsB1 [Alteromonas mediterranea 615]